MPRTSQKTGVLAPRDPFRVPGSSELPLTRALLIYEKRDRPEPGAYAGRPHAERVIVSHEVAPDGALAPGALLDPVAFADAILDAHHQEDRETLVFQPEHILAQGRSALVWWRPAAPAKLYFRMAENSDEPRYTALNGREIPLPALVFRGSAHGLMVWALAENRRPVPETILHGAPFMNIMADGASVCLGSARSRDLRDATSRASAPAEWERVFFESNFTHTPPALAYHATIPDYPTFLENLAADYSQAVAQGGPALEVLGIGPRVFPACFLRPCKLYPTLAHAITLQRAAGA